MVVDQRVDLEEVGELLGLAQLGGVQVGEILAFAPVGAPERRGETEPEAAFGEADRLPEQPQQNADERDRQQKAVVHSDDGGRRSAGSRSAVRGGGWMTRRLSAAV